MFNSTRRGLRFAAVVGLSGAVVVGLAGPAAAGPGDNQGTGIVAAGLIDAGPFSQAVFPDGPFTDTLVNVNIPNLASSGTITTNASETTADATVEDLSVGLSAIATLNASAVSSQCSYDPATQTLAGSASLADAEVTLLGILPDIALEASPAPNTSVVSIGGVAQIILNRQVTNPDGSLTVDAIYIELLNGQTVTVATSSCQPAVLVIPVVAPQFAAGAAALGLLGLGLFLYRRRQGSPGAA